MRYLIIITAVCILNAGGTGTPCEVTSKCANEAVKAYYSIDAKRDESMYDRSPSCQDFDTIHARSSALQFCYSVLSAVVNEPSCLTPPLSSWVDKASSGDDHDEVISSISESNHNQEGHHGWKLSEEARVWFFALGSVIATSVAGFACVLILPSMCTVCYNHFQQFLVAMAVGTLSGDAVLHLIPHSFFSHEDHGAEGHGEEGEESEELESSEQEIVMKGIVLLSGLFLLYTIEQLFAIVPLYMANSRAKKAHPEDGRGRLESNASKLMANGHSHDGHRLSQGLPDNENRHRNSDCCEDGDEHSAPLVHFQDPCRSSSSHHCMQPQVAYSTSCEEVVFRLHGHNKLLEQTECQVVTPCPHPCVSETTTTCGDTPAMRRDTSKLSHKCSEAKDSPVLSLALQKNGDYKHGTILHRCRSADNVNLICTPVCLIPLEATSADPKPEVLTEKPSKIPTIVEPEKVIVEPRVEPTRQMTQHPVESAISIISAMENGDHHGHGHGHSHGHGHGHSHSHFGDVNSRAWMVILADAFHNMVDGMAIGAAFSSSLAGGFSTTIAVAMHELPHELGDFAVLLKEGLSIKRGLMFNALSSVICLLGAVFGVIFGNNENFDQLIFALAAGVFLYVSLVDMLPQISTVDTSPSEPIFCHLIIRCTGMLAGTGIMIVVALLETRIGVFLDALV